MISFLSSTGRPMISEKTHIGISAATASTQSNDSRSNAASRIPRASARIRASYVLITRGVNPLLTIARIRVWAGGSVSSIDLRASSSAGVRSCSDVPPSSFEYVSQSFETATTSSYRVSAQNPRPSRSGCQKTGASRRSSASQSYGTPRSHRSRSVRSTSSRESPSSEGPATVAAAAVAAGTWSSRACAASSALAGGESRTSSAPFSSRAS
jgi:hypothetical protein